MSEYAGVNPSKVADFYGLVPTPTTTATMAKLAEVKSATHYSVRSIAAALVEDACAARNPDYVRGVALRLAEKYDARFAKSEVHADERKRRNAKKRSRSKRK